VSCGGVQLQVTDRLAFEPVSTGLAMVKMAFDMYPDQFLWKDPPYEYVFDKNPFDVIAGTDKIRKAFEKGTELEAIIETWQSPLKEFLEIRETFLIY